MESVRNKRTDFHKNELNKIETDIYYTSDEYEKRPHFLDSRNWFFEDQSKLYNCPKKSYLDCRKIGMILQNEVEIPEIPFIWWIIAIVSVIIGIYAHFEGPQYCLLLLIFGFIINTKRRFKHKICMFILNEARKIEEAIRKENEEQTIYKISSRGPFKNKTSESVNEPKTLNNQKRAGNESIDLLRSIDQDSEKPLPRENRVETKNTYGMGIKTHNIAKRIGENVLEKALF